MIEQRIAYSPDLLQKVINYLATKPYVEVVELIHGLQTKGVQTEHEIEVKEPTDGE
jgi:hypothetical protein